MIIVLRNAQIPRNPSHNLYALSLFHSLPLSLTLSAYLYTWQIPRCRRMLN